MEDQDRGSHPIGISRFWRPQAPRSITGCTDRHTAVASFITLKINHPWSSQSTGRSGGEILKDNRGHAKPDKDCILVDVLSAFGDADRLAFARLWPSTNEADKSWIRQRCRADVRADRPDDRGIPRRP